jgi:hypothetical protein
MLEVRFVSCDLEKQRHVIPWPKRVALRMSTSRTRLHLYIYNSSTFTSEMDSKYCSSCLQKRPLSLFLKDASNLGSKVLATCDTCRARTAKSKKRRALQPLDPNIQAKRRVPRPTKAPTRPNPSIPPSAPLESRLEATIPPPNPLKSRLVTPISEPTPPPIQPQAPGFLPADQWASIQSFNRAMEQVKMESCSRCRERWFDMDLKSDVCHRCFN